MESYTRCSAHSQFNSIPNEPVKKVLSARSAIPDGFGYHHGTMAHKHFMRQHQNFGRSRSIHPMAVPAQGKVTAHSYYWYGLVSSSRPHNITDDHLTDDHRQGIGMDHSMNHP